MLNVPTIDTEMREFILECVGDGMTVSAICDELHRLGFLWVREHDIASAIENNPST